MSQLTEQEPVQDTTDDHAEEGTAAAAVVSAPGDEPHEALVVEELLVEEVSIDGMCGVY